MNDEAADGNGTTLVDMAHDPVPLAVTAGWVCTAAQQARKHEFDSGFTP
jgi:hypothetical protein